MISKLGILDYGVGGLSVWREIYTKRPDWPMLYLAHNAGVPFGLLDSKQFQECLEAIAPFFLAQQAVEVFVACNAASTAIAGASQIFGGVRYVSMAPYVLQALQVQKAGKIGILGGERTIASQVYEKPLREQGAECWGLATQVLSAYVEDGQISGESIESYLANILQTQHDVDVLLLACTHYPALIPVLQKIKPHWKIVDPAKTVAENFVWSESKSKTSLVCKTEFWTSGDLEKTARASKQGFGVDVQWQALQ